MPPRDLSRKKKREYGPRKIPWIPTVVDDGSVYFWHEKTRKTVWELPSEFYFDDRRFQVLWRSRSDRAKAQQAQDQQPQQQQPLRPTHSEHLMACVLVTLFLICCGLTLWPVQVQELHRLAANFEPAGLLGSGQSVHGRHSDRPPDRPVELSRETFKVLCMYPLAIANLEDEFFALTVEAMSLRCAAVFLYVPWNQTGAGLEIDVDRSRLGQVSRKRHNIRIQRTTMLYSNATYKTMWEQVIRMFLHTQGYLEDFDFFIKMDDDSVFLVENFLSFAEMHILEENDGEGRQSFSKAADRAYCLGIGGLNRYAVLSNYMMSRGCLRKTLPQLRAETKLPYPHDDYMMHRMWRQAGMDKMPQNADGEGRVLFFYDPLGAVARQDPGQWNWDLTPQQQQTKAWFRDKGQRNKLKEAPAHPCCAEYPIWFHGYKHHCRSLLLQAMLHSELSVTVPSLEAAGGRERVVELDDPRVLDGASGWRLDVPKWGLADFDPLARSSFEEVIRAETASNYCVCNSTYLRCHPEFESTKRTISQEYPSEFSKWNLKEDRFRFVGQWWRPQEAKLFDPHNL